MGTQLSNGLYQLVVDKTVSGNRIYAWCNLYYEDDASSVTYGLSSMGGVQNGTSSAVTLTIKVNNVSIYTATLPARSSNQQTNISGTRSYTVTKTQSTQTIPLSLTVSSYSDSYNATAPAKWSYNVAYNTGPCSTVESQTKFYSDSLTLRSAPTLASTQQAGVVFLGWSFDNGTAVTRYSGGASFTDDTYCSANPVTAYMTADYSPYPKMTSVDTHRCAYSTPATIDDEGVCAAAVIDYTFGELMSQISFTGKVYSDASCTNLVSNTTVSSNVTRTATSGTGTLSGTKTLLLASASSVSLNQNTEYWAKITIQGTYTAPGASSTSTTTTQTVIVKIATAFFTMDVLAGGHGIAFGGPAKQSDIGYLVSYLKTKFLDDAEFLGDVFFESFAGVIQMFAGSTAPNGWLICDGSAVSRTEYATLFAVISDTYGQGDGSTTFNLPDLRGRTAIGAGTGVYPNTSTNLTARTLGARGGHESMQSHDHNAASNGYNVPGKSGGWNWRTTSSGSSDNYKNTPMGGSTAAVASIAKTGSAGSGDSGNMQPFTVVNYIICTGKTS